MTLAVKQAVNDRVKYVDGLKISVASNTTLSVTSGACSNSTNEVDMVLDATTTLNAAVTGLNGIDTGTFAASKVYAVFLISDFTELNPPGLLMSLSATAPVMPNGDNGGAYNTFRRIGWAVSDGSTHFLTIRQFGNGSERTYTYDSPVAVLTGGTATTQTAVSLVAVVPAVSGMIVKYNAAFTPASASNALTLYPSASTGTSTNIVSGQVAAVAVKQQQTVPTLLISGVPKVDYKVSNGSDAATLTVDSFIDSL